MPAKMDDLARIKRLVLHGQVKFTAKAADEVLADGLTEDLVLEAIMNAPAINKKLRSKNPSTGSRERLYVIIGVTFDGIPIYTKGKITRLQDREVFYVLISSKRSKSF